MCAGCRITEVVGGSWRCRWAPDDWEGHRFGTGRRWWRKLRWYCKHRLPGHALRYRRMHVEVLCHLHPMLVLLLCFLCDVNAEPFLPFRFIRQGRFGIDVHVGDVQLAKAFLEKNSPQQIGVDDIPQLGTTLLHSGNVLQRCERDDVLLQFHRKGDEGFESIFCCPPNNEVPSLATGDVVTGMLDF